MRDPREGIRGTKAPDRAAGGEGMGFKSARRLWWLAGTRGRVGARAATMTVGREEV